MARRELFNRRERKRWTGKAESAQGQKEEIEFLLGAERHRHVLQGRRRESALSPRKAGTILRKNYYFEVISREWKKK